MKRLPPDRFRPPAPVERCWATGKVKYSSSRVAARKAKLYGKDAYPCIECGGWHIGSRAVDSSQP